MPDISQLSINTVTVRGRYRLDEIREAVARNGIPAVSPWRYQIADLGLPETTKRVRDLAGARAQATEGIARLNEYAVPAGVKLAIEPLHPFYCGDRSVINTLGQALDICNFPGETKDLLLDRRMMGDGVADIAMIRGWVEAQGYQGLHEVEIFSKDDWWTRDIDEVLQTCIDRHARFG